MSSNPLKAPDKAPDWIIDRVPQKQPMRFIDAVESLSLPDRSIVCSFTVGKRPCAGVSAETGEMPVVCLTETMAQSIAALMIAEEGEEGSGFRIGFILSVRKMVIHADGNLARGTGILSSVKITFEDDSGVCMAEAAASDAATGRLLAEARITVMKPKEEYVAELLG